MDLILRIRKELSNAVLNVGSVTPPHNSRLHDIGIGIGIGRTHAGTCVSSR